MADVFSKAKRSEIMSRVRSRGNQRTELKLIQILRRFRIAGWSRRCALVGSPDFVFPSHRLAVFVDGCFWHGCPLHGKTPRTNRQFWAAKLSRNKMRDRTVNKSLRKTGWRVLRLWQHELGDAERVALRFSRAVGSSSRNLSRSKRRDVARVLTAGSGRAAASPA